MPVDLRLFTVKPLGAKWMSELCNYMKAKPDIICNGLNSVKFLIIQFFEPIY